MPTFQLRTIPSPDGLDSLAAWFDDDEYLWNDERLRRPMRLSEDWVAPELQLFRPDRGVTEVLFNPRAHAVSERLRNELSKFDELEFLPVNIRDHGTYFILHVVTSCELPDGAKAHVAGPPSNNIVGIQEFPKDFESPHPFFRIRQPANSAAGRVGSCVSCIYLNEVGANAIKSVAGNFLAATEVDKMPRISPG